MDSTFAGQNKCNPETHDRPFVIEWDATDASSFQARTANDIVFVKYEGCNLTVIDSCSDDSVRGAFGSYKPIDWTAGAVERVDVDNMVDLYAKLPLGVALLGGRVESGEKFHMEYFVSGTRSATRPVIYQGDLAKNPGCAGVTHFVYGYNLGAFALGSQAKLAGHVGVGTVWGAGAGGDSKYQSAVEKKGGELGACSGASAHELDGCKVPVRLTLRPITSGESPDQQAARAPETPDALNLAGKLQASNEQQRKASEHWQAAQTKMQAGDGKGCLAELDAHDHLDARPEGLSTNPKSGSLRATCVMLSGQCAAGRAMLRKSYEASGLSAKPEEIDRYVDGSASNYCRGGSVSDRDTLLRALYLFQARQERVTTADCQKAYDGALRVVDRVQARDNYDAAYDARDKIRRTAASCFARAGDCVGAWRVTKEQEDAWARAKGTSATDSMKRSMFLNATGATCIDKDQGKLTDAETVFRAIAELSEARASNPPSPAYCESRIATGRAALPRALASSHGDDLKYEPDHLAAAGAECLALAGDCPSAWKRYADLERAFPKSKPDELERRIRDGFRDKVRECQFKPQGAMTPNETIYWSAGVLEDGWHTRSEPRMCAVAFESAKRAAPSYVGDKAINSPWHYATRDIPAMYARCMEKASDCDASWKAFQAAYPLFSSRPESDPQKIRASFESDVSACKK